jgi:hypothetical protein
MGRRQACGRGSRTRRVGVHQHKLGDAHAQGCFGDRRARPAGAQQHHTLELWCSQPGQCTLQAPAPADGVGVVAHGGAGRSAGKDHRVDGADRPRLVGQGVHQRQHGLLAGEGDVESGEPHLPGRRQQPRQGLDAEARHLEVDQLVVQRQALRARLGLVERGRQRALDAGADQADQPLVPALRPLRGGRQRRFGDAHFLNLASSACTSATSGSPTLAV